MKKLMTKRLHKKYQTMRMFHLMIIKSIYEFYNKSAIG